MAGNLYKRYVWLLDLVSSYNGITFEQISDRWQRSSLNDTGEPLPRRTLYNHIEAIDQMFDMRIVCQRKGGYRYHLASTESGQLSETQRSLLEHLRMGNVLMDSRVGRYVELSYTPAGHLLYTIADAIKLRQCVKLDWKCNEEKIEDIVVAPYYLKQFMLDWYLIGRAKNGKVVAYSLDSISNLTPTQVPFSHPEISYSEFYQEWDLANTQSDNCDDSFGLFVFQSYEDEANL